MYKVTFKFENSEDVTVFAAFGESLLEVARKTNVAIDAPCSGNASCGKCRVKLVEGELDSKQTRHISDEEYAQGRRYGIQHVFFRDLCSEVCYLLHRRKESGSSHKDKMRVDHAGQYKRKV